MQIANTRPDVTDVSVPILFEAACACSLASFAGSMVELTVDLWTFAFEGCVGRDANKVSRFAAK